MREMGAQWRHACASADVDHLVLRGLDVKIAEGADGGNGVARLEAEDVARSRAGRAILTGRRRGDADVEAELALSARIGGKRIIVAPAGARIARDQIEDVLIAPDGCE